MIDRERSERVQQVLSKARLDALACALPKNVLLLSGYWPVIGTSAAIAFADGSVELIVPEDEADLAARGRATRIHPFKPASLDRLTTASEAIIDPLRKAGEKIGNSKRIGIEQGEESEPASYAATHLYQGSFSRALAQAVSGATCVDAGEILRTLRAVKTKREIDCIRLACLLTRQALEANRKLLPGITELQAAELFRAAFKLNQPNFRDVQRAEAFFWAMSGANSVLAHGAYARSRAKPLEWGDLVLVHCNTCTDGYWTNVTRTYSIGQLHDRRNGMYSAILAAREAAFQAIRPGARAAAVDYAARHVLEKAGFGGEFKHSTGHGVGFGAISPNALPRIHPKSDDLLEPGMVFNVEPAIYIDGFGGIRHCDMVAVTGAGFELLTDFQTSVHELILNPEPASSAQSA